MDHSLREDQAASAPSASADAAPAAFPEPGRAATLSLVLVGALVVLSTAVIAPALPAIRTHFADDPRVALLVPMLVTLPALVIGLAAPVAGFILDRFGRYPVVLAALIAFILFGTGAGLAPTLDVLLWSRAGLGLAVAFLMAGFTSLVGDHFAPKSRARILGRQASLNSLMALFMTMLGGILTEWDWRAMFLVYLTAVPLAFMFARYVPRRPPARRSPTPTGAAAAAPVRANWLRIGLIYALALINMIFSMLVPTRVPFLIEAQYGGGAFVIAFAMSVFTLGMFPTAAIFGRLRARLSARTLFAVGFAALGLGFAVQGLAQSLPMLIAGMAIAGAGFGVLMPNMSTSVLAAAPPHLRGRLSGGLVSAIFMGQFLSPIFSQPLIDRYDIQTSFLISAGLAALVMLVCAAAAAFRR